MENNNLQIDKIRDLAHTWKKFQNDICDNIELDQEIFNTTFNETYSVLKNYIQESKIEKEHMALIVNAYGFATVASSQLDNKARAALVITERMLRHCVLSSDIQQLGDVVYVYLLEEREEIYIDFSDVDRSMKVIISALERGSKKNHK